MKDWTDKDTHQILTRFGYKRPSSGWASIVKYNHPDKHQITVDSANYKHVKPNGETLRGHVTNLPQFLRGVHPPMQPAHESEIYNSIEKNAADDSMVEPKIADRFKNDTGYSRGDWGKAQIKYAPGPTYEDQMHKDNPRFKKKCPASNDRHDWEWVKKDGKTLGYCDNCGAEHPQNKKLKEEFDMLNSVLTEAKSFDPKHAKHTEDPITNCAVCGESGHVPAKHLGKALSGENNQPVQEQNKSKSTRDKDIYNTFRGVARKADKEHDNAKDKYNDIKTALNKSNLSQSQRFTGLKGSWNPKGDDHKPVNEESSPVEPKVVGHFIQTHLPSGKQHRGAMMDTHLGELGNNGRLSTGEKVTKDHILKHWNDSQPKTYKYDWDKEVKEELNFHDDSHNGGQHVKVTHQGSEGDGDPWTDHHYKVHNGKGDHVATVKLRHRPAENHATAVVQTHGMMNRSEHAGMHNQIYKKHPEISHTTWNVNNQDAPKHDTNHPNPFHKPAVTEAKKLLFGDEKSPSKVKAKCVKCHTPFNYTPKDDKEMRNTCSSCNKAMMKGDGKRIVKFEVDMNESKKKTWDKLAHVRAIARNTVGQVPKGQVIVPKDAKKKPKHKTDYMKSIDEAVESDKHEQAAKAHDAAAEHSKSSGKTIDRPYKEACSHSMSLHPGIGKFISSNSNGYQGGFTPHSGSRAEFHGKVAKMHRDAAAGKKLCNFCGSNNHSEEVHDFKPKKA